MKFERGMFFTPNRLDDDNNFCFGETKVFFRGNLRFNLPARIIDLYLAYSVPWGRN